VSRRVVDWEQPRLGDPAKDVATCRGDLTIVRQRIRALPKRRWPEAMTLLDALRPTVHHGRRVLPKGVFPVPDKGPGSKGGAKKPKGGGKAATKNGKK
jgi:hypothetical protein